MKSALGMLVKIFSFLFGAVNWSPPPWLTALQQGMSRHPRVIPALLVVAVVAYGSYHYYQSLPKPLQYIAEASAPGITPIHDDELRPQPLRIDFSYDYETLIESPEVPKEASVAALALLDKPLSSGIRMEPSVPGEWRWSNDRTLLFTPQQDWPAEQRYDVRFSPELFRQGVRLDSNRVEFTTPSFSAELESIEFYQDPVDRKTRRVVATLGFTHAVDSDSLEKELTLAMRPSGAGIEVKPVNYSFSVSYDKHHRKAYIHSDPITLPEKRNHMKLQLPERVVSELGGAKLGRALSGEVTIPDIYSFFRVDTARAHIVRNEANEPEQILGIEFTDDVDSAEFLQAFELYLLPQRRRAWRGPREVTREVLTRSQQVTWQAIPNERDAEKGYNFRIDVPEGRQLYLRLVGGLTSINEFKMSGGYDAVLTTPSYPHELKITNEGSVLALSGEHKLGLLSRNLEAVRVSVGRVLPSQLNHLISQSYGDITNPNFNDYRFGEDNLAEIDREVRHLNQAHPKEANYASFDLTTYLQAKDDYGLFFVTVEGWDPERERSIYGTETKRLILISDLGIIVKENADKSQEIFVQSISDGKPLAGAKVELLGKNGLQVMHATTDERGHAKLPSSNGLEREKTPTVYLVQRGNDISFLPFANSGSRRLNFSRFDVGGQRSRQQDRNALSAFLFSDRGIYRPGDTVNLGAIVRHQDFAVPPAIPLQLEIRNPRGSTTLKKKLTLSQLGFFDLAYATEAISETGNYEATLYLIRENKRRGRQIGAVSFKVEEFQPDRMKIQSRILGAREKGWVSASRLKAEVKLENLFGTPAQERNVSARITLNPTGFQFRDYADYRFEDPLADPEKGLRSVSKGLDTIKTDADGIARFELPLEEYVQGTYRLSFHAQGFEQGGGRSVSASSSTLLSPLASLVGYKADGKLSYINKDSERTLSFIAIDSELAPIAHDALSLQLIEQRKVSTLVRQRNGTYKYQTVVKERPLNETPFAIAAGGSDYTLPTGQAGDFVLQLVDAKGLRLARISFSVVGYGNLDGSLEKNAELQLRLDKGDYRPGDLIEMNITAPYTGSGLITIESDTVHVFKWFSTTTTSSMQRIRVPIGLEGNAYVNVAFVRDASSAEIYTSPLSYAVAPFTIDRSKRRVEVTLEVPEIARPGKKLNIEYSTSRPSRLVVFAVDEGILQVANYQTPQPLDHFLRKRALEVTTRQMLDLILPEYELIRELSASGGGMAREAMMADALGRNLNPFARKVAKAAAFWSGIVEGGVDKRSVSFDIPESFSGQLRVMAVAISEEAMGSAQQNTLVRGPFVISPNVLTVAAPGDEFTVTVGVANLVEGSGEQAQITLQAEASEQLQILGESTASLAIAEGSEGKAEFRVRALDHLGAASLSFKAIMGEEDARISATLSVRPAVPYMASFDSGYEEDGEKVVALSRRLYPQLAAQKASASASPLVLVDGLNTYLENFPHGCTEQVVSQVFPLIGLMQHAGFAAQAEQTQKKVAVLINRLRPRQLPNGGFSLWPGGRATAEFPSVYVMHFLTEARAMGYAVPGDMYSRGLSYLRQIAGRGVSDLEAARVRAAAIYLLTRNGEVTTNDLVHLQEWLEKQYKKTWRRDLVAVYMGSIYQLLKKESEAVALVSGYRIGQARVDHYSDFHSPLTLDAQYLYLLANHFPERLKALKGEGIRELVKPVFGGHYNTIGSAYTILALGAYSKAVLGPVANENIVISETASDGKASPMSLLRHPFTTATPSVESAGVAFAAAEALFYQVSQAGFDHELPSKPIVEGLEVQRSYLDGEGNEVSALAQGQEVTVRLRIRSVGRDFTSNVAVVDLLPGGFEVLRSSVPRETERWHSDYVDIREDRVVFYGGFGGSVTELRYRAKLTASGEFVVPPAYAEAMYDRSVHGRSMAGRFSVSSVE
ncbi:MAG: alpha-2-macroglobulin [Pseudomonadota bacterium]